MAKVFYYSKRYSQQGNPIKTVTHNDLFTISRAVATVAPYKLGFRTYSATLNQLKTYTINEFKTKGLTFKYSDGLVGVGSTIDPVRVDKDWVNQSYIRASDWPFSQVGDPTDFTLPIAGSYFSVCYPFLTSCPGTITPYVEGNGDLRFLRHVTNGEQIAVVYSTWKNYKNTSVGTTVHSDNVYRPPGLADDEYIFHVFTASDTAMLVEIYSINSGFREYAYVILNGTLMAESHKLIRLGTRPITALFGTAVNINTWITYFRMCNVSAVIVKDVKYLVHTIPPDLDVYGNRSSVRVMISSVSDTGTVTRIDGWTATNSEGSTRTDQYVAVLNDKLGTYDDNDKDALLYSQNPPNEVWFGNGSTGGVASHNRLVVGGVNSKGYATFCMNHYTTMNTWQGQRDCKPCYFYDIDFDRKRIIPSEGATNRRWTLGTNESGSWLQIRKTITYHEGHYWASGIMLCLLNNGDRMSQIIPGSADVTQQTFLWRGAVTSLDTAGSEENFSSQKGYSNIVRVTPPTPVKSTYRATILHNKMRVVETGGPAGSGYSTGKSLALLSGSHTARAYYLLGSNTFDPNRTTYRGYELNDERQAVPVQSSAIYAFRKNGAFYYHNATWCSFDNPATINYWGIDANSIGNYQFKMSQVVADKLTEIMKSFPKQGGHTEYGSSYWAITPFYPNIGEPYALVRFLQSYRTPNSASSDGWSKSNCYQQFLMFPITLIVDSLNVATLTDVNLTGYVPDLKQVAISNILNPAGADVYGTMAFDISASGYEIMYRCGCSDRMIANSGIQPVILNYLTFDTNRQITKSVWSPAGVSWDAYPALSPIHGIGMVRTAGIGAFYMYSKYLPDTNQLDYANGSYILGTARPAAGFNVTVNTPFKVYVEGRAYTVEIQSVNLTNISSQYKNAHFYCYVVIRDGMAKFVVDKRRLDENLHRIYIGYIKTSDTEISEINCKPVTRWEVARPSIYPIGNALPASTGLPSDIDVKVWENATTIGGTPAEYLWGSDDIVDSDVDYMITDLYWAYDQLGDVPLTTDPLFGETIYLIVKTIGISDYVEVSFDSAVLQPNDMQDGTITGTVTVPLTFNVGTNVGIGYHKVRTWEVDDMAFNNATWLDVTAQRAFNVDYTNDLNFAIQVNITIHVWDTSGYALTSLLVDGVAVGGGRIDISSGSGQSATTLSAIVPAKSKYRLVQGSGVSIGTWAELGRR